jgi:D-glycero-alpha-D-manno-heptose 1-phosphate guanylyltransferase
MIKEAIILAGGLGTRLRSVVSDVPKCMAPVGGKPFLYYLIQYLKKNGIENFIFSVGYKHGIMEEYLQKNCADLNYQISLENEPLGTGGAIKLASKKSIEKNILICNGDTLYKIDIEALTRFHESIKAACTLALKPMHYFDRYGVVELNEDDSVKTFKEKQYYTTGLINGGVYALNIAEFLKEELPEKFSFEKDYLEKQVNSKEEYQKVYGMIQDEYFIDIGIPEDYEKAQNELLEN